MKLIDMLVEDGLNGWQWPDGVECITQDNGSSICKGVAFGYRKAPYLKKNIWLANNGTGHADAKIKKYDAVADDWATAIITREQYEAALAEKEHPLPWDEKNKPCPTLGAECRGCPDCGRRVSCTSDDITDDAVRAEMGMNSRTLDAAMAAKNEGWIEWGGGKHPPVSTNTVVDVKLEKGYVQSGYPAGEYSWEHEWADSNIIAYRLHQPQEAAQTKEDDEADLNECIGQDAAPVWNGEGLPPVGMEIEYSFAKVNYRTDFSRGKVLAYGMQNVFMEHWASKNEFIQPLDKIEFRPIRSEADKKRDEAVKTIMLTGWCQAAAEEIYDLVAAGKVPGMKLED